MYLATPSRPSGARHGLFYSVRRNRGSLLSHESDGGFDYFANRVGIDTVAKTSATVGSVKGVVSFYAASAAAAIVVVVAAPKVLVED